MALLGLFFCYISLALVLVPLHATALGDFSVELIHRDSPRSPFYDPSASRLDRWRATVERSRRRGHYIAGFLSAASADVLSMNTTVASDLGEYLMRASVGTPPFEIHAILDTTSDLVWTNCVPCTDCYTQSAPLFDPAASSTYGGVPCSDSFCNALPHSCGASNVCEYEHAYSDGSKTAGSLATDTFTFGSTSGGNASVNRIFFGCSRHSKGPRFDEMVGGVVGLGGGNLSLVSQLGDSIDHTFSYCLHDYDRGNFASKLIFGPNDRAPKSGLVKTPLTIRSAGQNTFYSATLRNIIVDNVTFPVPLDTPTASGGKGNIIIDSRTTIISLLKSVYAQVLPALKAGTGLTPVEPDPRYGVEACFDNSPIGVQEVRFPEVLFEFEGGAKVPIDPSYQLLEKMADKVVCYAITGADVTGGVQFYGTVAQRNYHVAFDLRNQQLSLAPNCGAS